MAIGWITALKLVPWSDVIEATPKVLQAAKHLMGASKKDAAAAQAAAPSASARSNEGGTPAAQELQRLRAQIAALEQGQQESARLIEALAEQNTQLVRMVDAMRAASKRVFFVLALLSVVSIGLLIWVARQ